MEGVNEEEASGKCSQVQCGRNSPMAANTLGHIYPLAACLSWLHVSVGRKFPRPQHAMVASHTAASTRTPLNAHPVHCFGSVFSYYYS